MKKLLVALAFLFLATPAFAQTQLPIVAGTVSANVASGARYFKVFLTGNVTSFGFTGTAAGPVTVIFQQDAVGGRTVVCALGIVGCTAVSSAPNAQSTATFVYDNSTNQWIASGAGKWAALPAGADGIQYVSNGGSDSNDGLSWGSAKLTIAAACAALPGGNTTCTAVTGSGLIWVSPEFAGTYPTAHDKAISILQATPTGLQSTAPFSFGGSGDNFFATLDHTTLTANQTFDFPNASGTLALAGANGVSAGSITLATGTGTHTFGTAYSAAPVCAIGPSVTGNTYEISATTNSVAVTSSSTTDTSAVNFVCSPTTN